MTPQAVIDTNVVIAAFRSRRGASFRLLSLMGTGRFDVHISVPLLLEYEMVLLRHQQTLSLSPDAVHTFLDLFVRDAIPHAIHYLWRTHLRDSHDAHVLELAVKAGGAAIITYNKKDFQGVKKGFGIDVHTAREFLDLIDP